MSVPVGYFTRFAGYDAFLKSLDEEIQTNVAAVNFRPAPSPFNARILRDTSSLASVLSDNGMRDLFSYVSINTNGALDLAHHPVTLMAINFMQKLEDYSWTRGAARDILFPGRDWNLSPNQFSIDGLQRQPFKDGGVALTAKAFYNNLRSYDDNINVDQFNSGVSAFNNYFNSNATALFAEYYRHTFRLSPSPELADSYWRLLSSKAYRMLKKSQLASAQWPTPALEIFNHFVKLKACGATDSDIANAYVFLTTSNPGIDPSAIQPLSANNWKSYRGWLLSGYIDWGDMHAQNMDRYYTAYTIGRFPRSYRVYFCPGYITHYGYWQNHSSSCFTGDAKVVLADGQSLRPIRDIAVGDEVHTRNFIGPSNPTTAKVAFVSQVPRDGRLLHSLGDFLEIRFTATHPIVLRGDLDMPKLGFVDPDAASSLNPTWHSIPTTALESVITIPPASDEDVVLYDLILEPRESNQAHPSTYVLRDSSGNDLEVASEAPVMEWFPFATCFFHSMTGEIKRLGEGTAAKLLQAFQNPISLCSALEAAAKTAWGTFSEPTDGRDFTHPHDISIQTMFGGLAPEEAQQSALVVENFIGRLGRLINDHIDMAWVNDADTAAQSVSPFLLLHTLTYLTGHTHPDYPSHDALRFAVVQDSESVADHTVTVAQEGWMTFDVQHALRLETAQTSFPLQLALEIYSPDGILLFKGRGPIEESVVTVIGMAVAPGGDEATMKIQVRMLDPTVVDKWQGAGEWSVESKAKFATIFGRTFTNLILDTTPASAPLES